MPSVQWVLRTGGRVFSSAAIGEQQTLYVGSLDRSVRAISTDGAERWSYEGSAKFYSSPAIGADGTVYIGAHDGMLLALDAEGNIRWQRQLNGPVNTNPLIGPDGTIYATSRGLHAFSPEGSAIFHTAAAGVTRSSPAMHPNGFIVFGTVNGNIIAVSTAGQQLWQTPVRANVSSSPTRAGRSPLGELATAHTSHAVSSDTGMP